jgi:RNA polymerase sigma-70 factor (ECF subfamily)
MGRPTSITGENLGPFPPAPAIAVPANADACLMGRFRAGERDAFAELYQTHHAGVFRFAFYMTADRDAAAEITQETFVWLIHHAARFDASRGDLAAFLGGVARKMVRRRYRFTRRWLPFESAPSAEARESGSGVEREMDAMALRKAIARLPVRYRVAVVLCDLEDKSYQDAAAELGCAVGTIRSRLHRGRELLARKFLCKKDPLL